MKPLILAGLAVCLAAGFLIGWLSAPHAENAPTALSNQIHQTAAVHAGGQESVPEASVQNLDLEKSQTPLTLAELRAEFAGMKDSGDKIRRRKLSDLRERLKASDLRALVAEIGATVSLNSKESEIAPLTFVLAAYVESDPQAALQAALAAPQSSDAVASVILQWSMRDSSAALKSVISIKDPDMRGKALLKMALSSDFISQMPNTNNHRALFDALMKDAPSGAGFQEALIELFAGWARKSPAAAAAAASELPAGSAFSNVTKKIASRWIASASNKQEVLDWVRNLPEGESRTKSLEAVFSEWSVKDPQAAIRGLDNVSGSDRKRGQTSLVSGWSRTDPKAAAKYVEHLPVSEQSGPMDEIIRVWASQNTAAAAAWVEYQPAGTLKDIALLRLSQTIAKEDPESALTWVKRISQEKNRLQLTEEIARDWSRQNPTAARAWISTSNLPEETRKELLLGITNQ